MSAIDDLLKALDKEIGKNSDAACVTQFIDTGYPPLNKIISGKYDGGLPFGRMLEVYGASSSGKTALATQWMINAQKMGGVAIFIDWERSFDVDMAVSMGLSVDRPYWIYVRPKTWEEGNIIATKACRIIRDSKVVEEDKPIIAIFDSIASALPKSSSGKEIDEFTMNDTTALARVTSTTLKNQAQQCADYNATYIYLNQVRDSMSLYGSSVTTPGGKAMEFYATARLELSRQKIMQESGKDKEMIGQNINIKCTKSKMTAPFKSCQIRLSFDELGMASFDVTTSLIDYLITKNVFPTKGYIEWKGSKFNGRKQLANHINEKGDYEELKDLLPTV